MERLKINQTVIHIPEGVCTVTETIERDLSSLGKKKYFGLVPVYGRGTKIYLPDDGNTSKIRELPEASDLEDLIERLPSMDSVWVENEKERQQSFTQILSRCETEEMMRLILTLRRKRKEKESTGKKFHSADDRVLKEAERIMHGEIGYILGLHPQDVPNYIHTKIGDVV